MVFFSEIKGRPLYDSKKNRLGIVDDLVFVDGEKYAEITHIIYVDESKYRKKIPFILVDEFKEESVDKTKGLVINLHHPKENINPFFVKDDDVLVGEILDKQVVDVDGIKVVRVNDVLLGKVDGKFCVVAVAVGARSLIKRLGLGKLAEISPKKIDEHIIQWESVERLEQKLHDLHLKIQRSKIADLHPEDIADVMEDLSYRERVLIFNTLNKNQAIQTLIGAEPMVQDSFFKDIKIERVMGLLEDIPPHQAADILSMMSPSKTRDILSKMRPESAGKIKSILKYPEESAGAIMDTSFISVLDSYSSQETIDLLRKIAPSSEKIYHIYVVDDQNHLIGVLSIRKLLTSPPETKVTEIMNKEVIHVKTSTSAEDITKAITKYDLFVIPVINDEGVLRGVVTADNVLSEIMPREWKRHKYTPHKIKTKKRKNGIQSTIKA
ncbi:MAG: CBS domain-containing protein [Candidatus Altiarchaeota archaeon]